MGKNQLWSGKNLKWDESDGIMDDPLETTWIMDDPNLGEPYDHDFNTIHPIEPKPHDITHDKPDDRPWTRTLGEGGT